MQSRIDLNVELIRANLFLILLTRLSHLSRSHLTLRNGQDKCAINATRLLNIGAFGLYAPMLVAKTQHTCIVGMTKGYTCCVK